MSNISFSSTMDETPDFLVPIIDLCEKLDAIIEDDASLKSTRCLYTSVLLKHLIDYMGGNIEVQLFQGSTTVYNNKYLELARMADNNQLKNKEQVDRKTRRKIERLVKDAKRLDIDANSFMNEPSSQKANDIKDNLMGHVALLVRDPKGGARYLIDPTAFQFQRDQIKIKRFFIGKVDHTENIEVDGIVRDLYGFKIMNGPKNNPYIYMTYIAIPLNNIQLLEKRREKSDLDPDRYGEIYRKAIEMVRAKLK